MLQSENNFQHGYVKVNVMYFIKNILCFTSVFKGLEKMERDKQKQMEREREKQESEIQTEKIKLSEKDAMEIIKSTVKEHKATYVSSYSVEAIIKTCDTF